MWILAVIMAFVSVTGIYIVTSYEHTSSVLSTRSQDLAANMAVYRSAVIRFAMKNLTYEGSVSDALLALPSWYAPVRNPLWTNHISNGMVVVYASAKTPVSIVAELAVLSNHSMLAGWKRSSTGTLWSPRRGDTGIPLSPDIPDGSPVWAAATR